jgi:hypothetical protein
MARREVLITVNGGATAPTIDTAVAAGTSNDNPEKVPLRSGKGPQTIYLFRATGTFPKEKDVVASLAIRAMTVSF